MTNDELQMTNCGFSLRSVNNRSLPCVRGGALAVGGVVTNVLLQRRVEGVAPYITKKAKEIKSIRKKFPSRWFKAD